MDDKEIMVKMVLDRWNALNSIVDNQLDKLSDHELEADIVPGKNRGIYLLGHLITVHDAMIPLLQLGTAQYPHLTEIFLNSPDKFIDQIPKTQELRVIWKLQSSILTNLFNGITVDEWFARQGAVHEEDFKLEPHRNNLNIVLIRLSHLSYHAGQLALLKRN